MPPFLDKRDLFTFAWSALPSKPVPRSLSMKRLTPKFTSKCSWCASCSVAPRKAYLRSREVSQREREKKRGYNKDQSQKNTQKGAVCSWHDTTVQKGFSPDKQTSKRNTDPQCEPEVLTRQKQSQNAASIGAMVLTTEALITDLPEKHGAAVPAGAGYGGGMDY